MRAVQITDLSGPATALKIGDVPEPPREHPMTPGSGVIVDVKAAGVSFPELLQTRGEYQVKPDLPFVPGSEVGGIVREVHGDPHGEAHVKPGDRVAAFCMLGAWADAAVAPTYFTFRIPDRWDYAQGAALVLNYHTAYFALIARGRLAEGETVVVHGAAGGVGTATLQVAKAWGAKTIGVVSSDEKEQVARQAGADEVVRSDGPWKDEVKAMTDGGAHLVLDPVGGDRFTDSLRSLREGGRVVVVGFTGGSIPEVRVNRLLLNNTEVIGAGWGASVLGWPERTERIGRAIEGMIEAGQVSPIVGARFPLEKASDALGLLEERGATGKVVLDLE
jgi:NADPH2:quinone reductase